MPADDDDDGCAWEPAPEIRSRTATFPRRTETFPNQPNRGIILLKQIPPPNLTHANFTRTELGQENLKIHTAQTDKIDRQPNTTHRGGWFRVAHSASLAAHGHGTTTAGSAPQAPRNSPRPIAFKTTITHPTRSTQTSHLAAPILHGFA